MAVLPEQIPDDIARLFDPSNITSSEEMQEIFNYALFGTAAVIVCLILFCCCLARC